MEIFRQYRSILKVFTGCTCFVMLFLLWQLHKDNLTNVTIMFGIFGFVAVPIVAVTFEAAAECTYPANEELSSALLMTSGAIFGVAFILIWGSQLPDTSQGHTYENQWNFSTYFLIGNGVVMLIFMLLFRGEYKRLNAEHQFSKYIEDLNEEDISVVESETWNEKQIQNNKRQQILQQQSNESSVSDQQNGYQKLNDTGNKTPVNKSGIVAAYPINADNSIDKPINYEQDV